VRSLLIVAFLSLVTSMAFAQSNDNSQPADAAMAQDSASTNSTAGQVPLPTPTEKAKVDDQLKDVEFAFDRYDLRMDDRQTLAADAEWLKAHPDVFVTIEGDADERGDIVYNVALSDKRATVTHDALVSMGVNPDQVVFATGWGKLYPVCTDSDESCWSRNRRAHFEMWGQTGQAQAQLETSQALGR
jgi:peptidoglycan-associated lipoprotein